MGLRPKIKLPKMNRNQWIFFILVVIVIAYFFLQNSPLTHKSL